jgi:hypothetical protein
MRHGRLAVTLEGEARKGTSTAKTRALKDVMNSSKPNKGLALSPSTPTMVSHTFTPDSLREIPRAMPLISDGEATEILLSGTNRSEGNTTITTLREHDDVGSARVVKKH